MTTLIQPALAAGKMRITLLLTTASNSTSLTVSPSLAVTAAAPGVVADLYGAAGALVASGESIIDMCNLLAGTYYLRVYDPTSTTHAADVPYTILIDAPSQAQNLPLTSNDTLIGSAGADTLVGGNGLDQIIPNFDNTINAESVEVRDVIPGVPAVAQSELPVTPAELPVIPPFDQTDPAVVIFDAGLQQALAKAVGVTAIVNAAGQFIGLESPIHQSQLVQLTSLDADGFNVADLRGLQYATNLVSLDLANNSLTTTLQVPSPTVALAVQTLEPPTRRSVRCSVTCGTSTWITISWSTLRASR